MNAQTFVQYRRKREGRTNYKKRLALLKSHAPRLALRKTNKHLVAQLITYAPDGDRVLLGVTSKALEKLGWAYSAKNLPAAYLTGYLLGRKAKATGAARAIVDLGLHTPVRGSRIYALLKGAQDAGLQIPADAAVLPSPERLRGDHIVAYAARARPPQFAKTVRLQALPETIAAVKAAIDKLQ